MVAIGQRAGVVPLAAGPGFARPTGRAAGNDLPAVTGRLSEFRPGPAPPGQVQGGQLGSNDGLGGADPDQPAISPAPHVYAWGEGDPGETDQTQSFRRFGIQGFNDRLRVVDRHAYWDTGHSRTGSNPGVQGDMPINPQASGPPRPDLRTVNRTVTYQIGSDATRNQDDLARPYTWLGEQGSGWSNINGGVPGLYIPYGTRGGIPYPIVDPTDGQGGPEDVWAGPPHGLHSLTYPDRGDTLARYGAAPQMVPGRLDRPSNSPQAGQSYSQTVQFQGATRGGAAAPGTAATMPGQFAGRGWIGG